MSAILAHSIFNNSIFYDFQLSNYRFKLDLYFSWQGESSSFSEFQLGLRFSENGYTSTQDSGRFFSQNINLGIQSKYIFTSPGSGINFYNGDMPVVNSLTLQYEYDDTEKYPGSITREIGNIFSFNYQYIFPSSSNNNLCFHKILFDGRKYFPLSLNNEVIAFKLVAGFISNEIGNDLKFKLGGNSSSDNLSSIKTDNFFLRGFPDSSFVGNHLLLTSLEYRFPVKLIENKIGFKWASIFLEQISGKLFLDMGNAWDKTVLPDIKDINIAIGAELDFKFKQRYSDQLIISLGIGKAINEPLPSRFYSRIGFSF